jgi:hypothetical protein
MPLPNEAFPDWDDRTPPAPPGKDVLIGVVLLLLAVLAVILWFADPAHQWHGKSRVDWPPPARSHS